MDTSKAVYGIIRYLDRYPDRRLAMSTIHVEEAPKHSTDWKDFYGRRLRKTQRKYLFRWERRRGSESYHSIHKKQSTIESTNLGADTEMVAMRFARGLTVALKIKLKMFAVPID